jgi:hypothetical protein
MAEKMKMTAVSMVEFKTVLLSFVKNIFVNYPSYLFYSNQNSTEFFFESIGSKGIINKVIAFQETSFTGIYNLALGDVNTLTNEVDDAVVTDNGDTEKVLATIFQIVSHYFSLYPHHQIYFSGNSPARNRLYRIAINHSFRELDLAFEMFGVMNNELEPFVPNLPYHAFLIRKK